MSQTLPQSAKGRIDQTTVLCLYQISPKAQRHFLLVVHMWIKSVWVMTFQIQCVLHKYHYSFCSDTHSSFQGLVFFLFRNVVSDFCYQGWYLCFIPFTPKQWDTACEENLSKAFHSFLLLFIYSCNYYFCNSKTNSAEEGIFNFSLYKNDMSPLLIPFSAANIKAEQCAGLNIIVLVYPASEVEIWVFHQKINPTIHMNFSGTELQLQ